MLVQAIGFTTLDMTALSSCSCAGGDKRTQASDIDAAVKYWMDYQRRVG